MAFTPVTPKKKPNKKKLGIMIGAAALVLVIGIGAAIGLGWYFGDEQKLSRAMKSGDLDAVKELVSENSDLRDNEALEEMLLNRVEELKTKVADGSVSCEDAEKELGTIERIKIKSVNKKIPAIREYITQIKESKECFDKAEELFGKEDYMDAMEWYLKVIEQDGNYEAAQSKAMECKDKYRDKMLKTAADLAAAGKYSEAITTLNEAKWVLGSDEAIQEQIDAYKKAQQDAVNQQRKNEALTAAESMAASGDYISAMNELKTYENLYGNDSDITAAYDRYKQRYVEKILADAAAEAEDGDYKRAYSIINAAQEFVQDTQFNEKKQEYKSAYVAEVCEQADQFLANKQYSSAKQVVQEALTLLPDDATLTTKMTEIELAQPAGLDTLEMINGDFNWNEGTPADPFGNTYSDVQNFVILHATGYYHNSETYSVEYKVDEKYDCMSMALSPYSDFKQDGYAYIQIYVNNILRYTSTKIYQKTQPLVVSNIDIHDATYVKIVAYIDGGGCLMLSDVSLSNPHDFQSELKEGYTSLASKNTFNGSLSWNNEYPQDLKNSDYSNVQNYAVIHASGYYHNEATHSAEYYLAGQYQSISFHVAPATDFGESGTAVVKIYVDDALVYTSVTVNQKTPQFSTGSVDLTGANYVKIEVIVQGHGCIIISDALLKNAE